MIEEIITFLHPLLPEHLKVQIGELHLDNSFAKSMELPKKAMEVLRPLPLDLGLTTADPKPGQVVPIEMKLDITSVINELENNNRGESRFKNTCKAFKQCLLYSLLSGLKSFLLSDYFNTIYTEIVTTDLEEHERSETPDYLRGFKRFKFRYKIIKHNSNKPTLRCFLVWLIYTKFGDPLSVERNEKDLKDMIVFSKSISTSIGKSERLLKKRKSTGDEEINKFSPKKTE